MAVISHADVSAASIRIRTACCGVSSSGATSSGCHQDKRRRCDTEHGTGHTADGTDGVPTETTADVVPAAVVSAALSEPSGSPSQETAVVGSSLAAQLVQDMYMAFSSARSS